MRWRGQEGQKSKPAPTTIASSEQGFSTALSEMTIPDPILGS
jgi:hypothetical protein